MNEGTAEILDDLDKLVEQARWAYTHGYWKAGHGLDRELGMDLSRSEAERMAGPTYDIQIGAHKARVAYQRAVTALNRADILLASLVETAQPRLARLPAYARADEMVKAATKVAWRATHATVENTRRVETVRTALYRARRGLAAALEGDAELRVDQSTDKGIPPALRCRICGWRRWNPKLGGRCGTCWKWLQRKGEERPAHLDGISPQEAKRKRTERGEGWGAA